MELSESNLAIVFKALGDSNRIHILKILRSGETCACKLLEALEISQPTLSHHMKILCDAEIVTGRKDGKWMKYSVNCETFCQLRDFLAEITAETVGCCEKEENNEKNCCC